MSESRKTSSAVVIWLGLAQSSFQKQKTVRFGDASMAAGGRIWSILTLFVMAVVWTLSGCV